MITWDAKKEQIFEMPTGGAAMMRQGPNLLKLARKEQCLALLAQLRNKFRTDGAIHRVFPSECLGPCQLAIQTAWAAQLRPMSHVYLVLRRVAVKILRSL